MAQSKFAMRMLEKQGWKEGDGLGRNRDGISKPIKAFMKRDKAGVGQDLGADLTDHWWLRVFNDAAKNSITQTNVVKEADVKENPSPQNRLYAGFRKGSTLKQGKEEKDSDCSSEDEEEQNLNLSNVPTLDDIHKYCGGATGHRAATLGIKMTGKLQRAAEHERLYNERLNDKIQVADDGNDRLNPDSKIPEQTMKRKKKRKKDLEVLDPTESKKFRVDESIKGCLNGYAGYDATNDGDKVNETEQEEKVKRKKSKKKKREREAEQKRIGSSVEIVEEQISTKRKKNLKIGDGKHSNPIVEEENNEFIERDNDQTFKHKKKKNKKRVL